MQLHRDLQKSLFGKAALATAVLGGFLLLAGAPGARAQGWGDYNRRVDTANWKLHQAIEHFGYHSLQARTWRHEQQEAYEQVARYRRHEVRERARQERELRKQERRQHQGQEHHREGDEDRYRHDGER